MQNYHKYLKKILEALEKHPDGLSITLLSGIIGCHRNSIAKYLDLMHSQGKVDLYADGRTKVYTLSARVPFSTLKAINSHYLIGVDRNLAIVEITPSFFELLGISDSEPALKQLRDFPFPPFHDPAVMQSIMSAIDGPKSSQTIELHVRKLPHLFELKCIPTVFDDQKIGAALLVSTVTNTQALQTTLRNIQERHRSLSEDLEEYIVRFYPDGTIIFANEAYCRSCGFSGNEIIGTRYKPIIPVAEREKIREHFQALTPDHPVATIEHRCILPNGSVRWQRWKDRCIITDGITIGYISIGSDITDARLREEHFTAKEAHLRHFIEEKTAEMRSINMQLYDEISRREKIENALKESERRYRSIVENQAELVCRWKPDGTITFVNEAMCKYMGIPRNQFLGQNCLQYLPPEDQERVIAHLPSMTLSHPDSQISHRIIHPATGEIRWQQWFCTTFFAPDGMPVEYQSVGRDSTDLIRMAEAQVLANRGLIGRDI